MEISIIDNILIKHPLLKKLSEADRLNIYNQTYSEIYQVRADTIPVYQPASDDVTELIPKITGNVNPVNLSAIRNVDNLLKEQSLLEDLSEDERILIYKIAQHQINLYRSFQHNQEYFFATFRADTREYTAIQLEPILNYSLEEVTVYSDIMNFEPAIGYTVSTFPLSVSSIDIEPFIGYTLTNYNSFARTLNLIPNINFILTINPADLLREVSFEPNLSYNLWHTELKKREINLEPLIAYSLMVSASTHDIEEEIEFEPTISYTLTI